MRMAGSDSDAGSVPTDTPPCVVSRTSLKPSHWIPERFGTSHGFVRSVSCEEQKVLNDYVTCP